VPACSAPVQLERSPSAALLGGRARYSRVRRRHSVHCPRRPSSVARPTRATFRSAPGLGRWRFHLWHHPAPAARKEGCLMRLSAGVLGLFTLTLALGTACGVRPGSEEEAPLEEARQAAECGRVDAAALVSGLGEPDRVEDSVPGRLSAGPFE